MTAFEKTFQVGWGEMDFNAHMRNTAYLDRSADVRMMYFAEHRFPMSEFRRLGLGPVILRDELEYFKELHLLETVRVSLLLAGLSPDRSRFRVRNEFFRGDGARAARVTSLVGWLSLAERRLTPPPPALAAILQGLPRTDDFEEIAPQER
jgi:acyl-CoA thioester hydrolase